MELTLWEDFAVIQYRDETFRPCLALINRSDNSVQTISQAEYFCVDGQGNLYCLTGSMDSIYVLEKHSLKEKKLVWSQEDVPFFPTNLWKSRSLPAP